MLQLPDIPGPGIFFQGCQCILIHFQSGFIILSAIYFQKVNCQILNIFRSFAQWRQMDLDCVHPVEEILTKLVVYNHLGETFVSGADKSEINRDFLC